MTDERGRILQKAGTPDSKLLVPDRKNGEKKSFTISVITNVIFIISKFNVV